MSFDWRATLQMIRETEKYKTFTNGTLRISAMDPATDGGEYTCMVRGSASSTAKKALYVDIIRNYFQTNKNLQFAGQLLIIYLAGQGRRLSSRLDSQRKCWTAAGLK